MNESMADIRVNDIFDELIEENEKITECLNVLIRFKTFVDLISDKLKNHLESKLLYMFEDFNKEVEEVFRRNEMEFTVNRNLIQRKSQLVESSKPPKSDEIREEISFDQTFESTETVDHKKFEALDLQKKKSSMNQKKTTEDILISDVNKRFVCSFIGCGKKLKTKEILRIHLKTHSSHPKPHKCHFEGCSSAFDNRRNLRDHINSHNGVRPFNCEFCPKRFTTASLRKRHTEYHHKVDQTLICQMDECYKEFQTVHSLKEHQKRSHLREKRFACNQPNCAFRAVNKSIIKTHVFNVHSDERPFVCHFEGCSKSFKNRHRLKFHIESHSSERKFKCLSDGCEKIFKSETLLKAHTRYAHSQIFSCDWPECEYTCNSRKCLRSHQVIHKSKRNVLCVCSQCGKAFKNKAQLDSHMKIHTNDKRYACSWPGCQYRSTNFANFYKHKRIHIKF